MAKKIEQTWAEFRTAYGINGYDYSKGTTGDFFTNMTYNVGDVGIYPGSPCSILFRATSSVRQSFNPQPFFILDVDGLFYLQGSGDVGGIIPDKEWAYFVGKSVGNQAASFLIEDSAQDASGQATTGFPQITGIEGFINF